MVMSAMAGVLLAAAAAWSPFAAALAAIFAVAVATADAGTINAGLVAASEPERRGAFLAVQAVSGFGASAVTPMLFGLILDIAGGAGSEAAWMAAFCRSGDDRCRLALRLSAPPPPRASRNAVARRVIRG
jgi:MFS family permease